MGGGTPPDSASLHAASVASGSAAAAANGGDASEDESDHAGDKLKSKENRQNIPALDIRRRGQREQNRERQRRFRERQQQAESGADDQSDDDEPPIADSDHAEKAVAGGKKEARTARERTPTPMSEDDSDPRYARELSGSLAPENEGGASAQLPTSADRYSHGRDVPFTGRLPSHTPPPVDAPESDRRSSGRHKKPFDYRAQQNRIDQKVQKAVLNEQVVQVLAGWLSLPKAKRPGASAQSKTPKNLRLEDGDGFGGWLARPPQTARPHPARADLAAPRVEFPAAAGEKSNRQALVKEGDVLDLRVMETLGGKRGIKAQVIIGNSLFSGNLGIEYEREEEEGGSATQRGGHAPSSSPSRNPLRVGIEEEEGGSGQQQHPASREVAVGGEGGEGGR
ncbi:hypothetical protein T484DRAFT_1879422, partial [Baffinella frigidus]